jgi:hypothetical protein
MMMLEKKQHYMLAADSKADAMDVKKCGHKARDCCNKTNEGNRNGNGNNNRNEKRTGKKPFGKCSGKCHLCGKTGHMIKECWKKQNQDKANIVDNMFKLYDSISISPYTSVV